MDNLFLNIIIPCYNAEKTIGFLLTSILQQTN
jgi:glycosyltransferase involved in cell wall biosynthesis